MWAFAASVPSLLGRNPWPLAMALMAAIAVRIAWSGFISSEASWSLFVRIAIFFSVVGVLFNVLTVRSGDRVIATLPDSIPLIGGEITLNAAFFGVLSGLALITLVIVGSTVAGLLDWSAVVRLLPSGLTTIAVAGSIAFAFVPQTAISYREIREAQSARGHRVRGARDLLPILVPMIGGGLERSITLAEALESRGFGATGESTTTQRRWPALLAAIGLAAVAIAIYLMASGHVVTSAITAATGVGSLGLVTFSARNATIQRSRYRIPIWTLRETAVSIGATISLLTTLFVLETNPSALRYEPYPRLTIPVVDLLLLGGLLGLFVPALVMPQAEQRR